MNMFDLYQITGKGWLQISEVSIEMSFAHIVGQVGSKVKVPE